MKTALITGGNSGIGKAVATALAKKGFRVIIHGKDPAKTKAATEEIKAVSGNKEVESIIADVSVIKGMKELADAVKQKTTSLEAMVLSAGVILPKHILTADDLEMGFAVQYLSRFALSQLLLPELESGKAKIVHVGAPVIRGAKIHFENIAFKKNFGMVKAMAQEMFANHLLVQEFARRHPDNKVVMNMAHVGIAKTDITRHSNFLFRLAVALVGKSPETLAGNFVYLASDEKATFSGYFLPKPGNSAVKEKIQHDAATAQKLWNFSLELIKPVM